MYATTFVYSAVTGRILQKFIHTVDISLLLNYLKSDLQHSNSFQNASATNKDEKDDFSNFARDIGCHGNIPSAIRKRRLDQQSTTIYLPFAENW